MGRRRAKQRQKLESHQRNDGDLAAAEANNSALDPPLSVLASQPNGPCLAVAHGIELWLLNTSNRSLEKLEDSTIGGPIRAVAFDPSGELLLAGGDDKTVRVWQMESMHLLHQWVLPKKISAATFSADGSFAFFADKFGDVHVAATAAEATAGPRPLLGHFCSIITDLAASPDGKFVVSTDRDSKIRIDTVAELSSTLGRTGEDLHVGVQVAHEVQSYCLGHTSFVTSSALVDETLLASASGDGTVRLWDPVSGQLLDTWHVPPADAPGATEQQAEAAEEAAAAQHPAEAASDADANLDSAPSSAAEMELGDVPASGSGYESDKEDTDEEDAGPSQAALQPATAAVLALAASPNGRHLAALVEGQDEVTILEVDAGACMLAVCQRLTMQKMALPTAVRFDHEGRLWAIGKSQTEDGLKVGMASLDDLATEFVNAAEGSVPWALCDGLGEVLRSAQAAHAQAGVQVNPQLRKRVYSEAETDFRKRNRRDIKAASIAAAASTK